MQKIENVVVYTKPDCPNCVQLKSLLERKGVDFTIVELDFGQPTTNKKMKIEDFKSLNPQVSQMPFFTSLSDQGVIQGGFMAAQKVFR